MIFGPDKKAGEMWTYGPPGDPVLYNAKTEATAVATSISEIIQREVGVYIEGEKLLKLATLIGFKESGCPPELKSSLASSDPLPPDHSPGSTG